MGQRTVLQVSAKYYKNTSLPSNIISVEREQMEGTLIFLVMGFFRRASSDTAVYLFIPYLVQRIAAFIYTAACTISSRELHVTILIGNAIIEKFRSSTQRDDVCVCIY